MPRLKEATCKLLVLSLDTLLLAFPLDAVQKVMRAPTIYKGGSPAMGITHVEGRETLVLDLHQRIYGRSNPRAESYLIVLKAPDGGLYGIPAAELPGIREVALSQLNPLSADYREQDSLGIASHCVVAGNEQDLQTIFLLDLTKLWSFITEATIEPACPEIQS